jgi:hypothetical protein
MLNANLKKYMTLKEAIRLKNQFDFKKVTCTTEETGDKKVWHYFSLMINNVGLQLSPSETNPNVWYGSMLHYSVKFYPMDSFKSLIKSIQDGEWSRE